MKQQENCGIGYQKIGGGVLVETLDRVRKKRNTNLTTRCNNYTIAPMLSKEIAKIKLERKKIGRNKKIL